MKFEDKLNEEMESFCRFRCDKKHTSLMFEKKMCDNCPVEDFIREIRDANLSEVE